MVIVAIALVLLHKSDNSQAAVNVVAKYPPGWLLTSDVQDVVSLPKTTFGVRRDSKQRIRFVRIGKDGRPRTVLRATLRDSASPEANWAPTKNGAVVLLTEKEYVENSEPYVLRHRQFVMTDRGSYRRIRGIPAGAIAARKNRVAALRWVGSSPVSYVVYDVGGKRPRLIASGPVPGTASQMRKALPFYRSAQFKIALLGDQLAVAQSGAITVFNWKRQRADETFPAATGDIDAVALTRDTAIVKTTDAFDNGLPAPKLTGYERPSGAVRWSRGTAVLSAAVVEGTMRLTPWPSESSLDIKSVNPHTGSDEKVGSVPSFAAGQSQKLTVHGLSMNQDHVTWIEQDCYWTRVLSKPLLEQSSRRRPSCDYSYVDNSMELSGSKLIVSVRSKHGMRGWLPEVLISGKRFYVESVAAPPGTRRVVLNLSRSAAQRIRRNPRTSVSVEFKENGLVAHTITDRVRLR